MEEEENKEIITTHEERGEQKSQESPEAIAEEDTRIESDAAVLNGSVVRNQGKGQIHEYKH